MWAGTLDAPASPWGPRDQMDSKDPWDSLRVETDGKKRPRVFQGRFLKNRNQPAD
ncbi:MAG: hypothetical protein AMXMBFR84_05700 [Candidatus Hydrogenedentota bacterium]